MTNDDDSRRPGNRDGFRAAGQPAGVAVDPSAPAGLGLRCPTCGVPPGADCLTNYGTKVPTHAARIRAALDLRQHDPLP
jgi:hypothetical protein